MKKFTPGPWTWIEDKWNGGYKGIVGPNNEEVLFANHRNDGDYGDAWFEDYPSEADRRLIVCAPKMYEALEEANSVIWDMWKRIHKAYSGKACKETFEAKEIAIRTCDTIKTLLNKIDKGVSD